MRSSSRDKLVRRCSFKNVKNFLHGRPISCYPPNDEDALAIVLPVIAEGGKAYKKKYNNNVPVRFIDGIEILAKQKGSTLYTHLVDWAKKCANEDSLHDHDQIVFVCSDSHILVLDQQSRLDALIEIDDVSKDQALQH